MISRLLYLSQENDNHETRVTTREEDTLREMHPWITTTIQGTTETRSLHDLGVSDLQLDTSDTTKTQNVSASLARWSGISPLSAGK